MTLDFYYITVLYILTAVIGLCVGSFLNVVIYRLPIGLSLSKPASHCPQCEHKIAWYDNIPVFSWLFLGGKCRYCKCSISPRYILVEILNAVLWIACLNRFSDNLTYAFMSMVVCSLFVCIAFIDLEHQIILDRFHIMLGVLALAMMFFDKNASVLSHIIGGAVGFLSFYLIGYFVGKSVKTEALGGGDIKLAMVCGFLLGWQKLLVSVIISTFGMCLVLALISLFSKGKGRDKNKAYPFAPFLTIGFTIAMLFGTPIISAYLHLFIGD